MKLVSVIILGILLFAIPTDTVAQLGVGSSHIFAGGPKLWADDDLATLKKTKTIFVYGPGDEAELDNWKKVMKEVWTITPVEFVSYDKISEYKDKPGYSFIAIRFLDRSHSDREPWKGASVQGSDMSVSILNTFLQLGMPKVVDGKNKYISFFRIELYPTFASVKQVLNGSVKDLNTFAYTDAQFYNYYPGLQKHLIQQANSLLSQGTNRKFYITEKDAAKLSLIKTETLYLPEYVLIDFGKTSGDESKRFAASEVMAKYPFKYEILSAKALSDKIVNGEKINYLVHTKSSTDNYFSVFNSKGEWAYSRYKPMTYVVKDSDLEDIAEAVDTK